VRFHQRILRITRFWNKV